MEQLFDLFLQSGLRPLSVISETAELEKVVNRSELATLLILKYYNEIPMSELASKLGSPLSTVTSLSKRLVHKGLVERNHSSKDQRIILVKLTDKGEELAEIAKGIIQKILMRVQAALSDEELNQRP